MQLLELMPLVSYALTVIGYLPELYALTYMIYTKRTIRPYASNSIWAIWISAAVIYAVYAYLRGEYAFVLSNGITAILCCLVFVLRLLHQRQLKKIPALPMTVGDIGLDVANVSSG